MGEMTLIFKPSMNRLHYFTASIKPVGTEKRSISAHLGPRTLSWNLDLASNRIRCISAFEKLYLTGWSSTVICGSAR